MPDSRETITEQLSLATVQIKTLVERLNTDSTFEDFAIFTECLKNFSQLIDRLIAVLPPDAPSNKESNTIRLPYRSASDPSSTSRYNHGMAPEPLKRKRRWLRYSLRTFLIGMLLLGVGLGRLLI